MPTRAEILAAVLKGLACVDCKAMLAGKSYPLFSGHSANSPKGADHRARCADCAVQRGVVSAKKDREAMEKLIVRQAICQNIVCGSSGPRVAAYAEELRGINAQLAAL